jgi:hypothetical protein
MARKLRGNFAQEKDSPNTVSATPAKYSQRAVLAPVTVSVTHTRVDS